MEGETHSSQDTYIVGLHKYSVYGPPARLRTSSSWLAIHATPCSHVFALQRPYSPPLRKIDKSQKRETRLKLAGDRRCNHPHRGGGLAASWLVETPWVASKSFKGPGNQSKKKFIFSATAPSAGILRHLLVNATQVAYLASSNNTRTRSHWS